MATASSTIRELLHPPQLLYTFIPPFTSIFFAMLLRVTLRHILFLQYRDAIPAYHYISLDRCLMFWSFILTSSIRDIETRQATVMDIRTNSFCASGMHLPNGSYTTFGGNGAIGPGGNIGSQRNQFGNGAWDATYQDFDGTKAIRILNPCTNADNINSDACQWYDEPEILSMQKQRWYSTAEPLADGTMVLIGGFVNGGYINRNYPNTDPQFSGGAAENTFEFFPANGRGVTPLQFLIKTSGLNAYVHAHLLNSGKILLQANYSTSQFS
jgi:hypothetical protein